MARIRFTSDHVAAAPQESVSEVPADYEELFENYWRLMKSRARKAGVPPQDLDDVTSTLAEKMLVKEILTIYDPRKSRFASYVTVFCDRYLLWEREKIQTRQYREPVRNETPIDEGGTLFIDLVAGVEEIEDDVLDDIDFTITVEQAREAVVAYQERQAAKRVGKKRAHPVRDLVALFDLIVEREQEREPYTQRTLAKLLGVTDSTVSQMRRDLRTALRERSLTPQVVLART